MSLALGVVAMVPTASSQATPDTAQRLVLSTDGGFPDAEIVDGRFSADGEWFVFSSLATNLVDSAPSGFSEVYALETATGDVRLLTQIPEGGGESDGDSFEPVVCGDGSVVAFTTEAELLDPAIDDDFNGEFDVYVIYRDYDGNGVYDEYGLAGGVRITRAGVGLEGTEADFGTFSPAISDDCSTVAFTTVDPLADNDLNDNDDVYVRDITALPEDVFDFDGVELVSVGADPNAINAGGGQLPSLSADGSKVAFISVGSGLVTGPDAGKGGVFLRDLTTQSTQHVSVRASGGASSGAPDPSRAPSMTPDGSCVAFKFLALDLAPGVVNNQGVFVRDVVRGSTTLISKNMRGVQAIEAGNPAISPDCRYAGFDSRDGGLVRDDTNGSRDAFVHDLVTGGTDIISRKADGSVAEGNSEVGQLLASGDAVVISSAPEIRGVDGGTGIIDPFLVPVGKLGFRSPGYPDVEALSEFDDSTAWLAYHGIGNTLGRDGLGRPLYSPSSIQTRAGFALFIWRMMDKPASRTSCGYTDARLFTSDDQRRAACWLKDNGYTTAVAFRPFEPMTRGALSLFLWGLAGKPSGRTSCGFADFVPVAAREGACWMLDNGISLRGGFDNRGRPEFRSNQPLGRRGNAVFLYRLASQPSAWNLAPDRLPPTINFSLPR